MAKLRDKRHLAVLVGLLLVLAGVLTAVVARRPAPDPAESRTATFRADQGRDAGDGDTQAVKLEALTRPRPDPLDGERNPFRFGTRPAPSGQPQPVPSGGSATIPGPAAPLSAAPALPGGPPPIPLKFIGVVDAPSQGGRIAVLSDGRGMTFYGRESEVVDGRFRIVRIGVESIEMMYLDGRGRQTIRLSGQ